MNELTHVDLFSGIGGFALAAKWNGLKTVVFCERDKFCQSVLRKQFDAVMAESENINVESGKQQTCIGENEKDGISRQHRGGGCPSIYSDICTFDGTPYAGTFLLTGGFPCQPYSVAGKRRGPEDDRALWPEMFRVIKEVRPTWVLGENVAGFITMELDRCISDLEGIDYSCEAFVIPACSVDAKHRRDRVWIVGHSNNTSRIIQSQRSIKNERGWIRNTSTVVGNSSKSKFSDRRIESMGGCESQQELKRSGCGVVADSLRERGCSGTTGSEDAGATRESSCSWQDENDWFSQSGMGRLANGVPGRVARLKALGNAIVPQVAAEIIRAMVLAERPTVCL